MTVKVIIDGFGEVIVTPKGREALLELLAAERGEREPLVDHDVHPAARSRLIDTGLVEQRYHRTRLDARHLVLTPAGLRAAYACEVAG